VQPAHRQPGGGGAAAQSAALERFREVEEFAGDEQEMALRLLDALVLRHKARTLTGGRRAAGAR